MRPWPGGCTLGGSSQPLATASATGRPDCRRGREGRNRGHRREAIIDFSTTRRETPDTGRPESRIGAGGPNSWRSTSERIRPVPHSGSCPWQVKQRLQWALRLHADSATRAPNQPLGDGDHLGLHRGRFVPMAGSKSTSRGTWTTNLCLESRDNYKYGVFELSTTQARGCSEGLRPLASSTAANLATAAC